MDDELQGPEDYDSQPSGGERIEVRTATVLKIWKSKSSVGDWRMLQTDDDIPKWSGMVGEDVTVGVELTVEGYPKHDRNGTIFEITNVRNIVGNYAAEIQWLASEFKDIGPKRAKEIQKRYGTKEELRDMLFNRSDELTAISGITAQRAKEIGEHYVKFQTMLDTTFELVNFGIKPYSLAKRAVKHFGSEGLLDRIQADPYILYDVTGVTFDKCDTVAESIGVRKTDPRRFRCWLRDQLEQARSGDWKKIVISNLASGDCLALSSFIFQAQDDVFHYSLRQIGAAVAESEHLEVVPSVEAVRDFPSLEVKTGDVIMGGVMLADLDRDERTVADSARELGGRPNVQLPFTPDMGAGGKKLDVSQERAVLGLVSHGFAVMTGGPGTGKTTTLKTAIAALAQAGHRIKLAAPTGKAAKRMTQAIGLQATTIHRLLEWTPDGFQRNRDNPIDADVVVLDESSMIDISLAADLFSAIGPHTRLLFVGDADQLPPVGPGQPFFDLITSKRVPTFVLTETHRQAKGSWVIENARKIIDGVMPDLRDTWDFNFVEAQRSEQIVDYVIRAYRDARREGYENELQVLAAVKSSGAGVQKINREVQEAINPNANDRNPHVIVGKGKGKDQKYLAYIGDKVIYTKNNVDLGLVNGDTGVIVDMQLGRYADQHVVFVRFDGFEDSDEHPDGVFELKGEDYVPLELAYALTVHKSQGSEWRRVIVIADQAHTFLRRQLLYTAITRTSERLTIVGTRGAVQRAVNSGLDTLRATRLIERLLGVV